MKRCINIGLALVLIISVLGLGLFSCTQAPPSPSPAPSTSPAAKPAPAAPTTSAPAAPATSAAAPQKVFKLKFATGEAQDSYISRHLVPAIDRMKKRSNGRLDITYYASESLVKPNAMLDAVRKGVADMGFLINVYWPQELVLNQGPGLPGLHPNAVAGAVWYNTLDDYFNIEFERLGIHSFGHFILAPLGFYSPYKPLRNLDDLKGLLIRGMGGELTKIQEQLGAKPIQVTGYELFDALQKRTVDVGVHTAKWMFVDAKFLDLANPGYYLDVGFGATGGTDAMNLEVWNSLPKDLQRIIEQEDLFSTLAVCANYDAEAVGAFDLARKKGVTINSLSTADRAKLDGLIKPAYERWAESAKAKNLPGQEVLDELLKLKKLWEQK